MAVGDAQVNFDRPSFPLIEQGEILSCQLTPAGSNYTFVAQLQLDGETGLAIYKPRDGESPLWDFPSGTLYKRELAAYLLDEFLGWNLIPPTVIRDGPYGIGSVQQYVEHDSKRNYHNFGDGYANQLKTIACFDLVANSTDRKANHMLEDVDGKLWSIDHGLTFHADTKIRTVIWDFCGQRIPKRLLTRVSKLKEALDQPAGRLKELVDLLLPEEVTALHQRVEWVLTEGVYPGLPGRRGGRRR
jgi:hypothetical protein